jgi:hypothetical protein
MNIAICTTPGETPMQQGTYEMVETKLINKKNLPSVASAMPPVSCAIDQQLLNPVEKVW